MIFVSASAAIIGLQGDAWAHPKPHGLNGRILALAGGSHAAVAAAAPRPDPIVRAGAAGGGAPPAAPVVPSPHPAPLSGLPLSRPGVSWPAVPAPMPQAAPVQGSSDRDVALPGLAGAEPRIGPIPPGAAADAPVETTHTHANRPPRASTAIGPERLDQSLVYSSAVALAIAASGLAMLGTRRRLW
jgi:hypothetical protein